VLITEGSTAYTGHTKIRNKKIDSKRRLSKKWTGSIVIT